MPVSYDSSQLLKCSVSFTYSRYVISRNLISKDEESLTRQFFNNQTQEEQQRLRERYNIQ